MRCWCVLSSAHALDWVDVVAFPESRPHRTSAIAQSLSAWLRYPRRDISRDLQNRLKRFIESGQLGSVVMAAGDIRR
ncbi:nickel-dependent hydrogenase large subunit [Salmonella enterica subsp. enterica]|nr:nickel-dependent hydrogenase large subunit [Salmonella enterica subsp. enterica]